MLNTLIKFGLYAPTLYKSVFIIIDVIKDFVAYSKGHYLADNIKQEYFKFEQAVRF